MVLVNLDEGATLAHIFIFGFTEPTMWGFLSKDPAKDFPYELGEAVGQVALENKYIFPQSSNNK